MKRNWKRYRPTDLRSAIEACVDYAADKKNRSIDRIADRMGTNKWTLYKWIESGKLPANQIAPFELACSSPPFVSIHLSLVAGFLPVQIPTGKRPTGDETLEVQSVCNSAVQEIVRFARDEVEAEDVVAAILPALQQLAFHKNNAERFIQPELSL